MQTKASALKTQTVPGEGLEPTRANAHWLLRPVRLPIPPPGQKKFKQQTEKYPRRDSNPQECELIGF